MIIAAPKHRPPDEPDQPHPGLSPSAGVQNQLTNVRFLSERSSVVMEQSALVQRLSRLPLEPNPVLLEHARERTESLNNRIADLITAFAGSMLFVYIHLL